MSILVVTMVTQGDVVSYEFTGRVNFVFGAPFYGITPAVDDPVNGTFRYESSIVGVQRDGIAYFDQPQSNQFGVTLRGLTIMSDKGYTISLLNNVGYDSIAMFDNDGRVDVSGFAEREGVIELHFSDGTETALGTQHVLPVTVDLSNFSGPDSTFGEVNTVSVGVFSGVVFSIDSLTAVPILEITSIRKDGTLSWSALPPGGTVDILTTGNLDGPWVVAMSLPSDRGSAQVLPSGDKAGHFIRLRWREGESP